MLERRKEEKKKIAQTAGKLKRKKDKKSNYTRNLLTGFRDTINNNSSTTEQKVVESGLLQSLFGVLLLSYRSDVTRIMFIVMLMW